MAWASPWSASRKASRRCCRRDRSATAAPTARKAGLTRSAMCSTYCSSNVPAFPTRMPPRCAASSNAWLRKRASSREEKMNCQGHQGQKETMKLSVLGVLAVHFSFSQFSPLLLVPFGPFSPQRIVDSAAAEWNGSQNSRFFSLISFLVPKLRLGTDFRETPFRDCPPASGREARNRVSQTAFPNGVWEREHENRKPFKVALTSAQLSILWNRRP